MTETPLTASEHRARLQRLATEFAELMRRSQEFGTLPVAVMVASCGRAMMPHMRALGVPDATIQTMLAQTEALMVDVSAARASLARIFAGFDALAAEDPALAERLVKQFAETGRFLQAERETLFRTPPGMQ